VAGYVTVFVTGKVRLVDALVRCILPVSQTHQTQTHRTHITHTLAFRCTANTVCLGGSRNSAWGRGARYGEHFVPRHILVDIDWWNNLHFPPLSPLLLHPTSSINPSPSLSLSFEVVPLRGLGITVSSHSGVWDGASGAKIGFDAFYTFYP